MTYLLDINVLIALIDEEHVHHEFAHTWFEEQGMKSWATCAITENGVLRIVGSRSYVNSPGSPALVAPVLRDLVERPGHQFWAEDIRLIASGEIKLDDLTTAAQVTDSYLLALALSKGGRLATFDARLSTKAVCGGEAALHVLGVTNH